MRKMELTRLSDGSVLYKMSARELITIPTWHGNRIVDPKHTQELKKSTGHPKQFDIKPFHIVRYNAEREDGSYEECTAIVDGQHRVEVIKEYFESQSDPFIETDFTLLVIEKHCYTEQEVVQYFKILNTTKSIEWRDDPRLIANRYLEALCNKINTKKRQLIRNGKTRRPYLSLETLRDQMVARRVGFATEETPEAYAERIYLEHKSILEELSRQDLDTLSLECKAGLKAECMLGCMISWDWIDTV